jgi:hypothetical protein
LSDPSGNSYLENLNAPRADPAREVTYFVRSQEQVHTLAKIALFCKTIKITNAKINGLKNV